MTLTLTGDQLEDIVRLRKEGLLLNSGMRLNTWRGLEKITLDLTFHQRKKDACRIVDQVGGVVSLPVSVLMDRVLTDEQKKEVIKERL